MRSLKLDQSIVLKITNYDKEGLPGHDVGVLVVPDFCTKEEYMEILNTPNLVNDAIGYLQSIASEHILLECWQNVELLIAQALCKEFFHLLSNDQKIALLDDGFDLAFSSILSGSLNVKLLKQYFSKFKFEARQKEVRDEIKDGFVKNSPRYGARDWVSREMIRIGFSGFDSLKQFEHHLENDLECFSFSHEYILIKEGLIPVDSRLGVYSPIAPDAEKDPNIFKVKAKLY